MYVGRVVGSVVCTHKDPALVGVALKLVEVIENGVVTNTIVAADAMRLAGNGDFVYLIGSKEAAMPFLDQNRLNPFDASIMGFIDEYNENI